MRFTFNHWIERGDEEIELRVCYSMTTPRAATYLQPAEGGEVEIVSVKRDGADFRLTDAEENALLDMCEQRAPQDYADELAEAAEWRAQSRRDAILMDKGAWS